MMSAMFKLRRGFVSATLLAALLTLGGCATTGTAEGDDPLEPFNRAMYEIHQPLETYVARPVVDVYEAVVPKIGRELIGNFFGNIGDLFSGISGLLQGKFDKAGDDFGRVVINTSFGLGGLLDFASEGNIPRGGEDMGLLLAHYGVGPRPYLFIPLLGPMTARDGVGLAIQSYASPINLTDDNVALRNTLWGASILNSASAGVKASDAVGDIGLDRYTFIRGAYLQRRAYLSGDKKFGRVELDENYDDGYSTPPAKNETETKTEDKKDSTP